MRSSKRLERSDGSEQWLGAKSEGIKVKKGDMLYFNTWGGGGWGDPLERDPELVGLEIRQGLVTPEGARDYGVIADEDGAIDSAATEALRSDIKASREKLKLFDYGPGIEALRATCEEETGLSAPKQPQWGPKTAAA